MIGKRSPAYLSLLREGERNPVKCYRFVDAEKANHSIAILCRVCRRPEPGTTHGCAGGRLGTRSRTRSCKKRSARSMPGVAAHTAPRVSTPPWLDAACMSDASAWRGSWRSSTCTVTPVPHAGHRAPSTWPSLNGCPPQKPGRPTGASEACRAVIVGHSPRTPIRSRSSRVALAAMDDRLACMHRRRSNSRKTGKGRGSPMLRRRRRTSSTGGCRPW